VSSGLAVVNRIGLRQSAQTGGRTGGGGSGWWISGIVRPLTSPQVVSTCLQRHSSFENWILPRGIYWNSQLMTWSGRPVMRELL
jgi:hypothetical protein